MKLEKKHLIWIGVGVAAITAGIIIHKKRKAAKKKATKKKAAPRKKAKAKAKKRKK